MQAYVDTRLPYNRMRILARAQWFDQGQLHKITFSRSIRLIVRYIISWMSAATLLLCAGCLQTPRPSMIIGSQRGDNRGLSSASAARGSAQVSKSSSNRFTDTTVVHLAEAKPASMGQILRQAQAHIDEQRYEAAMEQIRIVMETADQRDSLAQEAQFMLGELYVQQNEFDNAYKAFSASVQSPLTVAGVREKSLLRLGHVYCAKGKNEEAAKVFKRFVEEFPGSSYVQLANCSSVGR